MAEQDVDENYASISNDSLSSIASSMSSDNMSKFAEKFLNIKKNKWGYNYALLKHWRKYAGRNAKQVLYFKLYILRNHINDRCHVLIFHLSSQSPVIYHIKKYTTDNESCHNKEHL